MKVDIVDSKKKKVSSFDFSEVIVEPNSAIITQYVHIYKNNQRQSTANTKDRSEVRGGGRKPWRQKGTGRARFGSSRNPIWTGGGVTFGPSPINNYKRKTTKKFRRVALQHAFSSALHNTNVSVIDEIKLNTKAAHTKQVEKLVSDFIDSGSTLIVIPEYNELLLKAVNNLSNVKLRFLGELNAYDVYSSKNIIIAKDAAEALITRFSKVKK